MGQLARRRGMVLVLGLGLVASGPASAWGAGAVDPATQSQPQAAAGVVDARAGAVVAIEIRLAQQSSVRDTAETAAATAGEGFLRADQDRQDAAAAAARAATSFAAADAAAQTSRRDLVAFALAAARSGGTLDGVQAFLSADGFDQVVQRSAVLHRLGARADRTVQRFRAATVVAAALDGRAHRALAARARAAEIARAALAGAIRAQSAADAAVSSSRARRDALIVQLAAARSTTVPIERAGQDRLDADRAARVNAVAQAARTAPAPAASGAAPAVPPAGPPAPAAGQLVARRPAASPAATAAPSTSVPTRPASPAAAAAARATPAPAAGPRVAPPPPVAPPARVVPPPVVTTRAPAGTPAVTAQPGPARTGSARGSAAGGAAAVAWASTQLNLPYVWGATGPDAYDCSGLTMRAWQIAGVAIPRTSRDQYTAAGKIGYPDLRPGDLIFWGTDPLDPATIYHVAMWVGGGQIVEAARPGVPSRITPMGNRWANTMAYAGRP